ncbi:MAG: hypothetical protein NTV79_07415 [Candidatus Aureabacteria bacterium]|nr:hypothetical protein [Candidatus Auribacterota bacterium]
MTTKTIIAIVAILACLLAPATIPAAVGPNLPSGAVGYIWTPNADKLFTDADQFLSALGTPNASLIIIKALLGNLLGNPDLGAVDLKGPLAIVMLNPKENPNPLAACFQVSQPESYLKGMENPPVLKSTDEKSGAKTYARKTSVFDNAAYDAADAAEKHDRSRFYTTAEETFLVLKGTSAWISDNPALLDQVKGLSAQDLAAPVATDLVLVFETELLVKMFREEADKNLAAIAQAGKGAASEEMLRSQLDLYLKYAGQVKRAIFGLTLSKEGIACEKIVEAKPGSTLAAFLSAQKSGELKLARFLDPRAWFVMDYRLRKPEMLLGFYTRMFDLMTAAPPLAEGGEKPIVDQKSRSLYLQSVKALLLEGMGEEAAVGISTAPGELFSAISFQQIKSEEAWKNYLQHGVLEMLPLWKTVSAGQGVTYDLTGAENPVKYKTADVYTVRVRLDKSKIPGKEQMDGGLQFRSKELGNTVRRSV